MPKSNLPAHMDSVRQKLRPKHQLLILKCYPRLPKNSTADVKPNGSELSYLLFYASTRSSKLQKVGQFLERKTAGDVAHLQSARVSVTLQIITALLDKLSGADSAFELIAPFVLRILLDVIVHTNDISLIEASRFTWDAFCRHQSSATLITDREYRDCFEKVVEHYAVLATGDNVKKLNRTNVPAHDVPRLREIGLRALHSVLATTTNLAIDAGTSLLDLILPAILSNLHGDDVSYLENLLSKSKQHEIEEKERNTAQRQSLSTNRTYTATSETTIETDPRAAEGTTQEADALAEEAVALLALDCLKTVFASETRAQLRGAAVVFLDYVGRATQAGTKQPDAAATHAHVSQRWATRLFELCTAWTPVQDRFVIFVSAVEMITSLPIGPHNLRLHLRYIDLLDHILRSDLNLIGLSVMDVLLALVQQILQVLQLNPSSPSGDTTTQDDVSHHVRIAEVNEGASQARLELLVKLKGCIANLATHVYYMDQISNMISAILIRLKPNLLPSTQTPAGVTAAAIQEPQEAMKDVAANVARLTARSLSVVSTNPFFSFDLARRIALEAVSDIILVANSPRSVSLGSGAENHSCVPITVWEGTQWLLRDPSFEVRRAYVDALTTWLSHETTRNHFYLDEPKKPRKVRSLTNTNGIVDALARRAASNASRTEESVRLSSFLPLLHLAIYENATQFASSSEADVLLLHALLTATVQRLGVNAVHAGLPMLLNLQDDGAKSNDGLVQVRLGALVYGYLRTVVEQFSSQSHSLSRAVLGEIERRKAEKWWVTRLDISPLPVESIAPAANGKSAESAINTEPKLARFDRRQEIADVLADYYRTKSTPALSQTPVSPGRTVGLEEEINDERIRQPLMATWTREGCLASIAAVAPRSQSLSGSRSSPPRFLAPRSQAHPSNGHTSSNGGANGLSPTTTTHRQQAFAQFNTHVLDKSTDPFVNGKDNTSSVTGRGTVTIDELKRVLADGGSVSRADGPFRRDFASDDTSSGDSMIEVDEADLDVETPYYRTPPQSAHASVQDVGTVVIPEDGAGSLGIDSGFLRAKSTKSLRSQGYSIATSKKKNVSILLGRIPVDNSEERVVAMDQPPY